MPQDAEGEPCPASPLRAMTLTSNPSRRSSRATEHPITPAPMIATCFAIPPPARMWRCYMPEQEDSLEVVETSTTWHLAAPRDDILVECSPLGTSEKRSGCRDMAS